MIAIVYDANGSEVFSVSVKNADQMEANVPPGGGWVALDENDPVQLGDGYIVEGVRVIRPTLDLPAQHTIPADTDWALTDIPASTELLIDGATVATVEDGEVTITFPEAGAWGIELRPPFPWRDATCEVMVT